MENYIRVELAYADTVDKYLGDGWEIIDTAKSTTGYEQLDTTIKYHVGLPARVQVDRLMAIIRDYEDQGLKEKLFEGVAEKSGETVSDYEIGGRYHAPSKIARYMENYEDVVNNRNVIVSKKPTQEELAEQGRAEENW
jgi:hypothetical protein